jgi:hypothetical protein
LLAPPTNGFHAFIDFIFAKRENRLDHLAKKVDIGPYNTVKHLKNTHIFPGKAPLWFIYDLDFNERRVESLSEEEKYYPLFERIDDTIMVQRVNELWTPDQDKRI